MDKIRKALLENHAQYKTDEEGLNHAESAIDDIERRAEAGRVRTDTGNADVGRGVRRIAENFTSRYIREGGISFIGERVSSPQQLASLMQTYRNPLYETSRIFYVKDEQLVCAESMTNRLPGLVKPPFETYQAEADHIMKTMESYGADTFYLLHNHPTGDPTPSFQDRLTTDYIAKHTEGFGGHVIINHVRYALVNEFNDYEIHSLEDYQGEDLFTTASLEHPLLNKKIRSSKTIAAIGKQLELTENTSCFIFLDGSLDIRKMIEVSNTVFSMEDFPQWLREETVRAGSVRSALVTQDDNIYENSRRLIEEGYLYDAVFMDPELPFYWSQKEDAAIRKKEEYIFAGLMQDDLKTYMMKQDINHREGIWKEAGIAAGKNAAPTLKEKDDFLSNVERKMERMGTRNTEERMTTVVNLFGGPGAGKTTCAWEIAAALKKKGFVTEYVSEYAKDLVWDGEVEKLDGTLQNQKILYKEQLRRVERLIGKVDFIVTDSPTLLSLTYLKEEATDFRQQVTEEFKEGNNFCLVVQRGKKFEQEGRIHNLQQSKVIDKQIKQMLDESQVPYGIYTHEAIDNAVKNMIRVHFARVAEMEKAEEDIKELQSRFSSRDKEYMTSKVPAGNLLTQKLVVLDVETTGLDSKTDEILQLSMIDEKGRILFNEYLKPQYHTSWEDAQRIHHITPDDVKDCQPIQKFLPEINEIIRNADVIVGYNHEYFDIPFLKQAGVIIPDDKKTFDVMHKFSPVYGQWDEQKGRYKWQKVTTCAVYYGYEPDGSFHDSLEDVRATLHCYQAMHEKTPDKHTSKDFLHEQGKGLFIDRGKQRGLTLKDSPELEI